MFRRFLGQMKEAVLIHFSTSQDLDSLRHQLEQLVEENVELELELQRSLEQTPGSPGEGKSGLWGG